MTGKGAPAFDVRVVATVARKELRESFRNRWFVLYSLAFALLALALSYLSLVGTGTAGLAGFGRTAAGLINLVMLIVPLMALTAGAGALAGERDRGTLPYLLAQPVSRLEILLGKYLGLSVALAASLAFGFGVSAAVIAWRGGGADTQRFAMLVGLAMVLALTMLGVGMLISALARRGSSAIGCVIFVWLVVVLFGDLGLMGSTIAFKLQVTELFALSLVNPLQVFKMSALGSVSASLDVLGPAGFYAQQTFGSSLALIFAAVLGAWLVGPVAAAWGALRWRGAA